MKDRLTIIRVIGRGDPAFFSEDLERWGDIIAEKRITLAAAEASGEIEVTYVDKKPVDDGNYITLVKIGNDDFKPSVADMEFWRNIFQEAKDDPDFIVFTGVPIEISYVKIGQVVGVE